MLATAQATWNTQLVYTSLPTRTAVVIFTGHSDPRLDSALNGARSHLSE